MTLGMHRTSTDDDLRTKKSVSQILGLRLFSPDRSIQNAPCISKDNIARQTPLPKEKQSYYSHKRRDNNVKKQQSSLMALPRKQYLAVRIAGQRLRVPREVFSQFGLVTDTTVSFSGI